MKFLNDDANAQACMASQVDFQCQRQGITLTPVARQQAIEFATKQWQGRTVAGDAAKAGVDNVTPGIIRHC